MSKKLRSLFKFSAIRTPFWKLEAQKQNMTKPEMIPSPLSKFLDCYKRSFSGVKIRIFKKKVQKNDVTFFLNLRFPIRINKKNGILKSTLKNNPVP